MGANHTMEIVKPHTTMIMSGFHTILFLVNTFNYFDFLRKMRKYVIVYNQKYMRILVDSTAVLSTRYYFTYVAIISVLPKQIINFRDQSFM